jgi:hypothetical protein
MKRTLLAKVLIFALGLTMLTACGGGGGGANLVVTTTAQPTTAVLTLSTSLTAALPTNTTINGYDVTITLPAGVTVKTMLNSSETGTGVVTASGMASGALISGVYAPATGTLPGTVKLLIASSTGFNAGEFSHVTCDIAGGHYPKPSDFPMPTFTASGIVASPTVSTIDLTGYMSLTATAVIN